MGNAFLALRLADAPRDRLARVAERLQEWNLPAAWTHPEDYHLTLVFLGRIDDTEAGMIPHAIDLVAGALARPRLRFAGLGATGGRSEPRVVYAALEDAAGGCADMHHDLCDALGMEPEKRFLPHVTLCRPKTATPREVREQPLFRDWPHLLEAHGQADWGTCETTHLVLYRSEPERLPRYRELAKWELSAA
jgi:2'-5' RNA ligase